MCKALSQQIKVNNDEEARRIIKKQHELDQQNLEGGVLGDKNKYVYLSMYEEEELQKHLDGRLAHW